MMGFGGVSNALVNCGKDVVEIGLKTTKRNCQLISDNCGCLRGRKIVFALAASVAVYYVTSRCYRQWKVKKELQARAARRRKEREAQFQALTAKLTSNGILITPERLKILDLSTEDLLKKLQDGVLKAIDVLHAFQAKALEATQKCNCVIKFLPEAEEWAKAMDIIQPRTAFLHGLPVCVKEDFAVKDCDFTAGFSKNIGNKEREDATMVTALKRVGAVPFCITNVPQTLMVYSCSNPIYGNTSHPTHPDRTPGGSSGGTAALIASGACTLGLGSDCAGSLRIPAHFCGIASLKPTQGRLSIHGMGNRMPLVPPGIALVPGLMGKDVQTIVLGYRAIFSNNVQHELDPIVSNVPWRENVFKREEKLRIGYYETSNVFPVTPGCRRALKEAVDALKAAGHTLIEFPCPDSKEIVDRIGGLLTACDQLSLKKLFRNEVIDDVVKQQIYYVHLPSSLRKKLNIVAKLFSKHMVGTGGCKTVDEVWEILEQRQKDRDYVVGQWQCARLDVCLAPAFAFPSIQSKLPQRLPEAAVVYTAIFNYLDFPAGIVPVTRESAQDQTNLESYKTECDIVLSLAKKATRGSEGLPIGVQVIGLPWEEEKVLRAMNELEQQLKRR